MQNTAVAEVGAFVGRQQGPHYFFDFFGVFFVGKAQACHNTHKMRVAYNSVTAVNIADYQVCRFASDTGQSDKLFDCVGDFSVEVRQNFLCRKNYIVCLLVIKSARLYDFFDLRHIGVCHIPDSRVLFEKHGRYLIYPFVGTLCRKANGDKQSKRLFFVKGAHGIRIFLFQRINCV